MFQPLVARSLRRLESRPLCTVLCACNWSQVPYWARDQPPRKSTLRNRKIMQSSTTCQHQFLQPKLRTHQDTILSARRESWIGVNLVILMLLVATKMMITLFYVTDDVNISRKITQLWFLTLRTNRHPRSSKSPSRSLRFGFATLAASSNSTPIVILKRWRTRSQIIPSWEMSQRCLVTTHHSLIPSNVTRPTQYPDDNLCFDMMIVTYLSGGCLSSIAIFSRRSIPILSWTWSYSNLRCGSCRCPREYLCMFLSYWNLLWAMQTQTKFKACFHALLGMLSPDWVIRLKWSGAGRCFVKNYMNIHTELHKRAWDTGKSSSYNGIIFFMKMTMFNLDLIF